MKVLFGELQFYFCNHVFKSIPSRSLRASFYRKVMGFEIGNGMTI